MSRSMESTLIADIMEPTRNFDRLRLVFRCGDGGAGRRRRRPMAAAGLWLLAVPFAPATNALFYVGFVVAERVLYVPSMGFCLLLGVGYERLAHRLGGRGPSARRLARLAAAAALLTLALRAVRRNADWADDEQLYRSAIAINPPKGRSNLT